MTSIKQVFVVEDDPISSFVIKLSLEQHPAFKNGNEFKNGQEAADYLAVERPKEEIPDLILLDINMPVLDGWGFLDKFEKMAISSNIPVVMLTSSINPEDIEKAQSNDLVKGFLSKPLNAKKLDQILEMK